MNEKFFLMVEFLVEVWEEKLNWKVLNVRRKFFDLLNVSFLLLFLVFGLRRSLVFSLILSFLMFLIIVCEFFFFVWEIV